MGLLGSNLAVGARAIASVLDALSWAIARVAVDIVRYQPRRLGLVVTSAASRPEVPEPVSWLVDQTRTLPWLSRVRGMPHALVRVLAAQTARWLGPTASVLVRFASGAVAATADRLSAATVERSLAARVNPGILVPHLSDVAILAVDMRGFSNLTRVLQDSQYLASLIEEYLSIMTRVVEHERGVVFQYTGDGLLALFLPELTGAEKATMLTRLVNVVGPSLHRAFNTLEKRWREDWRAQGRQGASVGLGVGMSFGRATVGFIGPSGKKQVGAIGDPVNQAAYLCSQAPAGTVLIDWKSFTRAGATLPAASVVRLRSKKPHQCIEAFCLRYNDDGAQREPRPALGSGADEGGD